MEDMSSEYKERIAKMQEKLERKLKSRGIIYVDTMDIQDEIMDAIDAVNERRRFDATPSKLYETKYESLIVSLALASITKYGAEGETAHSENGINRNYDSSSNYPESLMSRIVPLAKAR